MRKNIFREFIKVFIKSRNLDIAKVIVHIEISRSLASKLYMICSYFKSVKFVSGAIVESFREIKTFFQYLK